MSSNEELEEMIRHLQTRMVYLEGRVAQLEAGHHPYISQPGYWSTNPPGYYPKPKCSKCGMDLSNVMGYVCAAIDCPTFPKVTCTATATISGTANINGPRITDEGWAGKRRNGNYDEDGNWIADRSR